jgi:mono/diheme cytochrome c family protein
LTDCRAVDFFELYDRLGPGFAAGGNWAGQNPPAEALARAGYVAGEGAQPGLAEPGRYEPSPTPVPVPADLPEARAMERGQAIYLAQCAACHGVRGDGGGFMAAAFDVPPTDFRRGVYKFRSTASGELPAVEDLERIVRQGVPRSTMPAYGQFLTPQAIRNVALYLVVLSPAFTDAWRAGRKPRTLEIGRPPANMAILEIRGAELFCSVGCVKCHGPAGRGDGPEAAAVIDSSGRPIVAVGLRYKWTYKNGHRPEDVYRTLFGGLDGTPMPSYESALPASPERWALVRYVLSLSPEERPRLRLAEFAAQRRTRIAPDGLVTAVGVVPPTEGQR